MTAALTWLNDVMTWLGRWVSRLRIVRSVGPLTVDRHHELRLRGIDLHTFVNGEDVTNRCRFVDDTPGAEVAELFKLNAAGRPYLNPDRKSVAIEIVHEGIEVREVAKP